MATALEKKLLRDRAELERMLARSERVIEQLKQENAARGARTPKSAKKRKAAK